jgi:hypothetical protein
MKQISMMLCLLYVSNFSGTELIGFDPLTRKLEAVDEFGNIGAKLQHNNLDNIITDEKTKWPRDFDPQHGK